MAMSALPALACGLLLLSRALPAIAGDDERVDDVLNDVATELGVCIYMRCYAADSWHLTTYDDATEATVRRYLTILKTELSKYPAGYLNQSGVDQLILTRDLAFDGQARAAVPDPQHRQLFLSVNGAYGIASRRYLSHVLHHELQHCAEFMIWNSMTYDWESWMALNSCDFHYGKGGAHAYAEYINKGTDFYSPGHPAPGFVNRYATTGDEEDRAELMAFLMTRSERKYLQYFISSDTILRHKLELLRELVEKHSDCRFVFPVLPKSDPIRKKKPAKVLS